MFFHPLQMFGHLLGPTSFDSLKGLLDYKQAFLPITFSGIGFIPTTTIALTTYLRSWALVVSIIIVRLMVDQHFFLLKTLTWIDNNTFPFQQHLKATCDFLSPLTHVSFLLFQQLIKQQWFHFKIPFQNIYTIICYALQQDI